MNGLRLKFTSEQVAEFLRIAEQNEILRPIGFQIIKKLAKARKRQKEREGYNAKSKSKRA